MTGSKFCAQLLQVKLNLGGFFLATWCVPHKHKRKKLQMIHSKERKKDSRKEMDGNVSIVILCPSADDHTVRLSKKKRKGKKDL